MKHYGDIQKIDGHKVPLVDIIFPKRKKGRTNHGINLRTHG